VPDADIHADHGGLAVAGWEIALYLDGEGDKPAVGGTADGGGQDPGGALFQASGELAGGLVGLEDADPGKLDVRAVGKDLDGAGGEPAGISAASLPFRVREADSAALTAPGS